MKKSGVDVFQATIATSYPGTALFEKLKKENRLIKNHFPEDWQHYHAEEVVYKP